VRGWWGPFVEGAASPQVGHYLDSTPVRWLREALDEGTPPPTPRAEPSPTSDVFD